MITSVTYNIEEFYHVYSNIDKNNIDWSKDKKTVELKLSSLIEGIWIYAPKRKMITHTFSTYFKK
jgi:hypothetical protein